jgi:N,N'-diacetylchitobiose phosphorylase
MQFGHFDDTHKEYVIDRPDTPKPWSNYLGSTEYGAIITNHAGGYSFFRSSASGRFTRLRFNAVPLDQPGRYFYLRDRDDGDYWSTSWQPVGKPLAKYKSTCRHGTGYTQIDTRYRGIASETLYFVPLGECFEYWLLKLTNRTKRPRRLSVFTYVEYASEWNARADMIDLQYSFCTGRADMVDGMVDHIICNDLPLEALGMPRQRLHTFLAATGAPLVGHDTDREKFLGSPYRTYANPLVVEQGHCTGSLAWGDNACGTLQMDVDLAPGESRELVVMMGMGLAETEGRRIRAEFGTPERARTELARLKAHWHGQLGALTCRTPDPEFDSMVNVWNAYNCLITYAWSRAASLIYNGERDGLGYRDTVQDLLGVMSLIPAEAGKRLELMITGQCANGGAMPVIKPFEHRPGQEKQPAENAFRSDDCMWLFNTVPAYVKETGDLAFYRKVLPYADCGEDTVLGHLKRAIEFNLHYRGEHGLPAAMSADWNDCLGLGRYGESVFVAFQLRYALTVYADICTRLEQPSEVAWAEQQRGELDAAIQRHCWDGRWFVRAFRDDGTALGVARNTQGRIFLESNSWAVISGAATSEQAETLLEAIREELFTPYGLMLCSPGFTRLDSTAAANILGLPGIKENAGVFCHTQGWAVMAEALRGRGDRAYEYFRAYMPAAYNTRADIRETEPYVHSQSTHSRFSRKEGVSRLPWLTGAAAWSYHAATNYILGIQPEYDGLRVAPCIPPDWPELTVRRVFRGKTFDITIRREGPGNQARLELNGRLLESSLIPIAECRIRNRVVVRLS